MFGLREINEKVKVTHTHILIIINISLLLYWHMLQFFSPIIILFLHRMSPVTVRSNLLFDACHALLRHISS